MTQTELKICIDLYRRELRRLETIKVNCQSCEYYARPMCLKFNSPPPPDVIAQGCDEWTYDFVPF